MAEPAAQSEKAVSKSIILNEEEELKNILPTYLFNLLKITGYINNRALKDFDEKDIEYIETFAREDLVELIKKEEWEEYYGIYKSNPSKFSVVRGHKKVLLEYCSQVSKKMKPKPVETKNINEGCSSKLHEHFDLERENRLVKKSLQEWIKTQISELLDKVQNETENENTGKETDKKRILEKILNSTLTLEVECKIENENSLICRVTCLLCANKIKIYKLRRKESYNLRWVNSNFHNHFSKHLLDISSDKENASTKKVISKTQKAILQYFPTKKRKYNDGSDEEQHGNENIAVTSHTSANLNVGLTVNFDNDNINISEDFGKDFCKSRTEQIERAVSSASSIYRSSKEPNEETKYSRSNREKRKRLKIPKDQTLLSSYFPHIDKVTKILMENSELRRTIIENAEILEIFKKKDNSLEKSTSESNVTSLLRILERSAETNRYKSINNKRYETPLKKFCCYLFTIGGRLLYETLYSNLKGVLPSLSTIKREYQSDQHFEEGQFRFRELKQFLIDRNIPSIIWVSEDATRINGRVQYCSKSNKNVGFVLPYSEDGLLNTEKFKVT